MANLFMQDEQGNYNLNPDVTASNAVTEPNNAVSENADVQSTVKTVKPEGETVVPEANATDTVADVDNAQSETELTTQSREQQPNTATGGAEGAVGDGGAGGEGGVRTPSPTTNQSQEVPTHSLEDRGRADDSVIAGILKKAGIDAKDDAKRDRINKIMASVGAGLNMLQAIANIGAASRSNGRFVGNIDVAKPLGEGILADRARRKERDTARQAAIDKRAAMLDAQDEEQRKADRDAAAKALEWQRAIQKQSWQNAFTAAENEKKRKADAEKADKDRASQEARTAATIKAANARHAATITSNEGIAKAKRENDKAIAEMRKGSNGGTTKVDNIYLGKNDKGQGENVNISAALAASPATTGRLAQAWDKLKKHSQFEAFVQSHEGTFDGIVVKKKDGSKQWHFEEIDPMIDSERKPNAKILTLMQTFLIDHENDKSAETEAIRELFRQMAAEVNTGAQEQSEEQHGWEESGNDKYIWD